MDQVGFRVADSQNVVPLNQQNFDRIIIGLNIEIPIQSTSEEVREICFTATLSAIHKEEWSKIDKIADALPGLQNIRGRNLFFALLEDGSKDSLKRIKDIFNLKGKLYETICSDEKFQKEALHIAVRCGQTKLVCLLLEHIDIDQKDFQNKTALHVAIEEGAAKMVKLLLDNNCPIKSKYIMSPDLLLSPLALAVARGQIDCFDMIACKYTSLQNDSFNLLSLAIQFGQTAMLEHLLDKYSEDSKVLIEKQENGKTPFVLAASMGDLDAIKLIYQKVNVSGNDSEDTPLHMAIVNGYDEVVKFLLYLGAKTQSIDKEAVKTVSMRNLLRNWEREEIKEKQTPPNFSHRPPQNLVFKGGGPRGVAYIRALKVLEEKGALRELVRVAGTSAGAITAALIAVGCNSDMTLEFLERNPLMTLLDHPFTKANLKDEIKKNMTFSKLWSLISNPQNFINTNLSLGAIGSKVFDLLLNFTGLCEGEAAREKIDTEISARTNIENCTFGELAELVGKDNGKYKHLHVFATNIKGVKEPVHFSSEDPKWKDLIISDAICASMSIPGVFKPHILHSKNSKNQRVARADWGSYVDGGLLRNFPLDVFDTQGYIDNLSPKDEAYHYPTFNRRTLGFYVFSSLEEEKKNLAEDKSKSIETIFDLIQSVCELYYSAEELAERDRPFNAHRVVKIDCQDVGLLSFNLTEIQQKMLLRSAEKATMNFFTDPICAFGSLFALPPSEKKAVVLGLKSVLSGLHIREGVLNKLKKVLLPEKSLQKVNIFTLTGSTGVGKSELACMFANKYSSKFSFIFWVDCSTEESKNNSYRALANELDIFYEKSTPEQIQKSVFQQLETRIFEKPWLLICDDAEQNESFPQSGGSILHISKDEKAVTQNTLSVNSLNKKEAADFLLTYTGSVNEEDIENAKFYADKLEFLPISLHLAASYAKKVKISLTNFFEKLPKKCNELPQIPHSLQKVCELSLEYVKETHPIAYDWLNICSYFQSTKISGEMVNRWLEQEHSKISKIQNPLDILIDLSLIRYDERTKSFSLHSSIRECIQGMQEEKSVYYKQAFMLLLEEGRHLAGKNRKGEVGVWLHHMKEVLGKYSKDLNGKTCGEAWKLVGEVEGFFSNFDKSNKASKKALKCYKLLPQEDHTIALRIHKSDVLACRGVALRGLGKIKDALEQDKKALSRRQSIYGVISNHVKIAESLYSVGLDHLLGEPVELAKAKENFTFCLTMRNSLLLLKIVEAKEMFQEHTQMKISAVFVEPIELKKNLQECYKMKESFIELKDSFISCQIALGQCLELLGELEGARKFFLDALKYHQDGIPGEKIFNLPEIEPIPKRLKENEKSLILTCLGSVSTRLEKHAEAVEYYKNALVIKRNLLSSEALVQPLYCLGLTSLDAHLHVEAINYFQEVLKIIDEMKIARCGFEVSRCLKGIADSLFLKNDFEKSKEHYLRAIKKYKEFNPQADDTNDFIKEINEKMKKISEKEKSDPEKKGFRCNCLQQ